MNIREFRIEAKTGKILWHVLLHEVRHWAQIATLLSINPLMMPNPFAFRQIQVDLQSPDPERRGRAMRDLASLVKSDLTHHAQALPIFHAALLQDIDAWTILSAAHGLETILGPERAYPAWLALLNHPNAKIATAAVRAITHPRYVLPLIDVLQQRSQLSLRQSSVRALGRLKHPAIFPALLPHTVEALGDLGDPRAAPHLEALRNDPTEAWPEDNHGPMLRVGDLAREALARF